MAPESLFHSASLPFMEEMYVRFRTNPLSVAQDWRQYFEALHKENGHLAERFEFHPSFQPRGLFNPSPAKVISQPVSFQQQIRQDRVDQLIRAYRVRGHKVAHFDPLEMPRSVQVELDPSFYGLTEQDLDQVFSTRTIRGSGTLTLRQILLRLRNTYCRSIGVQFMHIDDLSIKEWLQERMEASENRLTLTREEQRAIFGLLTDADIFEQFIQKKFLGAKSFSLEGAESLIPLLYLAIEKAGEQGIREIVLAMAHRGRLNVLANIMGKSFQQIFREFEDKDPPQGQGDVKYHLGHSREWQTQTGKPIHLSLCFNPSHLEFINPVALGRVRAKQDRSGDTARELGMALLIHGDASFAGEGIIQETLNLSELPGYRTGGTLHVIVNNQIGFTTNPSEGRSTAYATDVARMLQSPIFHVNGEDPEAVAQVVRLAMDFRAEFKRDVFLDMYCFRRLGHNEGDEPAFTQPLLYKAIRKRKPVRESYLEHLLALNGLSREEAEQISSHRQQTLERELQKARNEEFKPPASAFAGIWSRHRVEKFNELEPVELGVETNKLAGYLELQTQLPEHFHAHPKILKILETRGLMAKKEKPLDWSTAENLALASLSMEGIRVRFSGQDSVRGTFSQRHAILFDTEDGRSYFPLQNLAKAGQKQGPVEILNSPLSEAGVLGFEYGYSLDYPDGLVLWEAQFGDFFNAAQVIIDQFLVSAEEKWQRLSGLVLLLPHGFEGQGPEHSSARLERFLTLAAHDNIQIVNPTTPAQYFYCLRRQVLHPSRKPLIVFTPKSLLRDPHATSVLEELAPGKGGFKRIYPDGEISPNSVRAIVLCSGKIFYDLQAERAKRKRMDLAILRLEQLYPLSEKILAQALEPFAKGIPVFFVQEEPENMGAWHYMVWNFGENLFGRHPFSGIYRDISSTPATGSGKLHRKEQEELLNKTFSVTQKLANERPHPHGA